MEIPEKSAEFSVYSVAAWSDDSIDKTLRGLRVKHLECHRTLVVIPINLAPEGSRNT